MSTFQKVTAEEIAQKLELSRTTVSIVLSGRAKAYRIAESTKQKVLTAAREMRYQPNAAARQLTGKKSDVIGVLVTSELMIDLRLIEAMEVIAARRGFRFMVGHALGSPEQLTEYLGDFRSRGVDGLVSFFHHHPQHHEKLLPELMRFENVVFYEKPVDPSGCASGDACYVGPDFFEVGRLASQRLVDHGRRRIGLVLRELLFPYARERRRAYSEVISKAGIEADPQLIWVMTEQTGRHWMEPFTPELATKVIDDLVIRNRADSLIAVNDLFAACLMQALRKRGVRVPQDVAVIGSDNVEMGAFVEPALTTVDLALNEVAKSLMEVMFSLLDGETVPKERRGMLIRPELIVRESG